MRSHLLAAAVLTLAVTARASAQDMPADYAAVLKTLGKPGDFKSGVLKVNIPRNDLTVAIDGALIPTPIGFGGWIALSKGEHNMDVMMGDLVLTEHEVNPVMSAVLDAGLNVTALHNHFFYETPRIFYMHVHGIGAAAELASKIKPAIDLIGKNSAATAKGVGTPLPTGLVASKLASIIGHEGEQNGPVYKITIARPDIDLREHGAKIDARMGLNTWAAFAGSESDAVVAGDVAMKGGEVTPVLKALRGAGLQVVAIHHHMTTGEPTVYFLHYWGRGPAEQLARGVRAAVDRLAK
jgi:hypothetical protein